MDCNIRKFVNHDRLNYKSQVCVSLPLLLIQMVLTVMFFIIKRFKLSQVHFFIVIQKETNPIFKNSQSSTTIKIHIKTL
ncbi:MAG: hypothetical protein CMH46_18225 [Muricauda sp.]|nr:hypothetical protein [Allomuricauda sp.]